MLKSVYSAEFIGTACSQVDANLQGVALLPSFPSYDVSVVETDFPSADASAPGKRLCLSIVQPGSLPLFNTVEILPETGDRFQFKDANSFADCGVVEGSAVSFNFDAFGSTKSETKSIQAGVIYYVKSVDVASSPPFFRVVCQRGAHSALSFKKVSSLKTGAKLEATFYTLEEGSPISFGFDIPKPTPKTEILRAGVVVYAKDVHVDPSATSPPNILFRVALRPGHLQQHISIAGIDSSSKRMQIHLANKTTRAVTVTKEKSILRASDLDDAPILDTLPTNFDSLTLEILQHICSSAIDVDVHILHSLSSFASSCKFFDVSISHLRSEFQNCMLQETRKHMENFIKPFRRDVSSLELVEYTAFRLLCLHARLHSHPISSRVGKSSLDSALKRVQAAWNVVNLYATIVMSDLDGMPTKDYPHSVQKSCSAFCVHGGVFVLARNGFFVMGNANSGKCISLNLDGFTKSDPAESCQFAATSGFRPCVVDAKFVQGSLHLIILTSPESERGNVVARLFRVDGISIESDDLAQPVILRSISSVSLCVGFCFPFNVSIPRFVTKSSRTSQYLHIFAIDRAHPNPRILSVSLPDGAIQSCELNFPTDLPTRIIEWGTFEYLSSALVQRPSQQLRQMTAGVVTNSARPLPHQDFWVLCRVKVLSSVKVLLWRFALGKIESTIAATLVDEEGLEIPNQDLQGPIDLWDLCLTNHGLGVGVTSPEGHFYHVIKTDSDRTLLAKIESPFFDSERELPCAKYVRPQVVEPSQ
jgi:hypothetical protein